MTKPNVIVIANGDLRLEANQNCWPEQVKVETAIIDVLKRSGLGVRRGHPFNEVKKHGFIDSQKYGLEVFRSIDPDALLMIVFTAWQYSHHILGGLTTHRGPILTVANWSGKWPGLVGMLNMNGCLTKAGISYSTLWSNDFADEKFRRDLDLWVTRGHVSHDTSHAKPITYFQLPDTEQILGVDLAEILSRQKAIMGVFDEGCMGMYNAIVPDELLHQTGVFKERLSQSALYYESTQVSDAESDFCRTWLENKGMRFLTGSDDKTDLTDDQISWQLKTYIAATRIADDFGCEAIGIQYQQGLKDLLPASDLAEGLLNNSDRPPVKSRNGARVLYPNRALPHFNEADECAGLDAIVTNRVWTSLGFDPETTLHDVRWAQSWNGDYVWVLLISGAAPPAHFIGGYGGATSERQPPMYFRLGGGTVKGVSKPGEIVWSRIYVSRNKLSADIGRAKVVALPSEETTRRWNLTTPQWPIMHAVFYGISRDQMMARHQANHIQVAYAPDADGANRALATKAAMFNAMGIETFVCGEEHGLLPMA